MKIVLAILVSLTLTTQAYSQKHFTILYNYGLVDEATDELSLGWKSILVIRDAVSYYYHLSTHKKQMPELPLGSKFSDHAIYTDTRENLLLTHSQPLGLRKYLVEDTLPSYSWEIRTETKQICGYTCIRAETKMHGKVVIAYYTTALPAKFGPGTVLGLPGTVLEVRTTGDPSTTRATLVETTADPIVPPSDGKAISREEFREKVRKHTSGRRVIFL